MKLLSHIILNDLGSSGSNLGAKNLRKSIKGSKDSDSSLEDSDSSLTKLWATILAHCPGDDIIKEQPKTAKLTLFLTTPTENPEPKSQKFFFQCKL